MSRTAALGGATVGIAAVTFVYYLITGGIAKRKAKSAQQGRVDEDRGEEDGCTEDEIIRAPPLTDYVDQNYEPNKRA